MPDTTLPTKIALDTLDALLSEVEDKIAYAQQQRYRAASLTDKEYWTRRLSCLYDMSDLVSARIATLKDEE